MNGFVKLLPSLNAKLSAAELRSGGEKLLTYFTDGNYSLT
jgi:hypothetical protein